MESRLSPWEIAGLALSSVYLLGLVGLAVADPGSVYVLWYLPNLAFALVVVIAVYRFRKRDRPLTFGAAVLVTLFGLCVTALASIALYARVFDLTLAQIELVGFLEGYLALWVLPVVCMFPLGAANRDAERLLVGGVLLFNALHFSNQYAAVFDQILWLGFCLLASLLGYPLAVLGNRS